MTREKLTRNFYRDEFACKDGCGFDAVDLRLVSGLQKLADITGAPVIVNSGCRCPKHNKSVGGVPGSQHLEGKAGDVKVRGYSPEEVADFAETIPEFENGGIIIYDTWVHLDVGDRKYRDDRRKRQ